MVKPRDVDREIWLIEDNSGDAVLIEEALEQSVHRSRLITFSSGSQALNRLHDSGIRLPQLILLDMNLPKMNGIELLQQIRSNHNFQDIPIVILTTSSSPTDIKDAYMHGANCFVTKSFDANDFIQTILKMEHFWLNNVTDKTRKKNL